MHRDTMSELLYDGDTGAEPVLSLRRFGYFLAAAVLAACTGAIVVKLASVPQTYSELIVGSIAWRFKSKAADYALLLSLIPAFLAWLALIAALAARLRRDSLRNEEGFHDVTVLLCAPAGMWFAGLLTSKNSSLTLLGFAGVLLLLGLGMSFLLSRRKADFWEQGAEEFSEVLRQILLAVWLAPLALAAVAAGVLRVGPMLPFFTHFGSKAVYAGAVLALVIAIAGMVLMVLRVPDASHLRYGLRRPVYALQVFLPFSFLLVVPAPWLVGGRLVSGYPLSGWAWAFVGLCMAGAWLELWRNRGSLSRDISRHSSALLTVSSIVAVVFFFKAHTVGAPGLYGDDYHEGEFLVPWWSLAKFQLLPFWDYAPARGLVNYVWGGALELFVGGTASNIAAMWPFVYLAMLFLAGVVLSKVLGKGVTALALFLFPYFNGFSEIDVGVTAFICVIAMGCLKWTPVRWLGAWTGLGVVLVLWAPGQGALAILATVPLGIWMTRRAWLEEPAQFRILSIALVAVAVGLAVTPLGRVLLGALRYGAEQSAVNSIAHGVNWSESFGRADANPWLYEIMRTSWLLVAAWAGVLILRWRLKKDGKGGLALFAYAVPLLILCVLYIFRAAGRIDGEGVSRLGIASSWALSLLLPLLIFAIAQPRNPGARIFIWSSLVAVILPAFGGVPTRLSDRFEPLPDPRSSPTFVEQVPEVPQLGSGFLNPEHVKRIVALKQVTDAVLDAGETYLDASGRHATYFYFDRPPPIESGSVYNLVTEKQQVRAVSALRRSRPPLVLVGGDNIAHDGGGISLRSHLLYRHLLLDTGYKVVKVGKHVWLINPEKLPRLAGLDVQFVSDADDRAGNPLLQAISPGDLSYIPASWGRSFESLEKQLRPVTKIRPQDRGSLNALDVTAAGEFIVQGVDPHVRFDLTKFGLDGREAGILAFDFSCKAAGPPPVLEVYWASGDKGESESAVARFTGVDGRMLVPLDAFPSWLLAKRLRTLRFDVQAKESCTSFRIENVQLLQRRGADATKQEAGSKLTRRE
jgi:hypothetical protein